MGAAPDPVYSHNNFSGSSGDGLVIDIGSAPPAAPPVMIVVISATATVLIQASHDAVNFVDLSGGGVTTSVAKDLPIGLRYWRTHVSANSGTVTSSVGGVPSISGHWTQMNNITINTNVTSGQ